MTSPSRFSIDGTKCGARLVLPVATSFYAYVPVYRVLARQTGMGRGKSDLLPWLVAAGTAVLAAELLPGNWYILLGGLTGSIVEAVSQG